jgi:hypothetical protein
MTVVSPSDLKTLEASLLNKSGNVPLHTRFRALFTLKALKSEDAVHVISEGLRLQPKLGVRTLTLIISTQASAIHLFYLSMNWPIV